MNATVFALLGTLYSAEGEGAARGGGNRAPKSYLRFPGLLVSLTAHWRLLLTPETLPGPFIPNNLTAIKVVLIAIPYFDSPMIPATCAPWPPL